MLLQRTDNTGIKEVRNRQILEVTFFHCLFFIAFLKVAFCSCLPKTNIIISELFFNKPLANIHAVFKNIYIPYIQSGAKKRSVCVCTKKLFHKKPFCIKKLLRVLPTKPQISYS